MAACAQDPHAEGGTKSSDLAPDSTRADNARGFPLQENWPIGAMVECAHSPIDRCAVQSFREVQNASHGVFRHRQGIAQASWCRHDHRAAPQIAHA
jgi:hypothetical protein